MTRSATRSLSRKTPALAEHGVDQRGLAVIDVGDDGDVADGGIGDRTHQELRVSRGHTRTGRGSRGEPFIVAWIAGTARAGSAAGRP